MHDHLRHGFWEDSTVDWRSRKTVGVIQELPLQSTKGDGLVLF
ncbi:hypothetical protein [Oscillatoria acuminata]|nr:hypothetical protein [Oscillatoria acuminata]